MSSDDLFTVGQISDADKDQRLLNAYIGKPEKTQFYQDAMNKLLIGERLTFGWAWSWWALIGGWAFLLYRKAYLAAGLSFVVSLFFSFIPFGFLFYLILSGGLSTYFVLGRYIDFKEKVKNLPFDEQISVMSRFGGFHQWVIWVYAVLLAVTMISFSIVIYL